MKSMRYLWMVVFACVLFAGQSAASATEPIMEGVPTSPVPPTADEYKASLERELSLLQTGILLRYQLIAGYRLAIEHAQWPWEIEAWQYEIMYQRFMIELDLIRCDQIRVLLDAIENGV